MANREGSGMLTRGQALPIVRGRDPRTPQFWYSYTNAHTTEL